MSADDRLHGAAMRAAAMLGPRMRAGEMMAMPAGGPAAWRGFGAARGEVLTKLDDAPKRAAAAQHHHREPRRYMRDGDAAASRPAATASAPWPATGSAPWPVTEDGARRRVTGDAPPPASRPMTMPAARLPLPVTPRAAAPSKVEAPMPRRVAETSPPPSASRPSPDRPPVPSAPPPPAPSHSPSEPSSQSAPPQFDEFRLARWLSDHLAEQTRRPARGGTGFDPRLSPPWPGTLQGPWGWGG